jgi:hypothetical protein
MNGARIDGFARAPPLPPVEASSAPASGPPDDVHPTQPSVRSWIRPDPSSRARERMDSFFHSWRYFFPIWPAMPEMR